MPSLSTQGGALSSTFSAYFLYRAALLAASAVATASRSLRTDATREARSERTRSASSSPASSLVNCLPLVGHRN